MERLFKIERDENYHDERLFEIQLLRRRIEKLRHTLFGSRRPIAPRNEEVQKPRPAVEKPRKESIDDIKAKLLGRKK